MTDKKGPASLGMPALDLSPLVHATSCTSDAEPGASVEVGSMER